MNSSDETLDAAVRAILAMPGTLFTDDCHADHDMAAGCPVCKGDVPAMVRAAYPIIAAAVRAEAVADERRRTLEWALAKAEDEVAVGDESWFQPEHGESATECTVRFIKALLAAGSVPVATPPAEPAAPRLWPCEHGERGWHRTDDNRHCLGGAAPSQPVTCEHGKTRQHYEFLTGCWCPGPVSVPKESSE